MVSIESSIYLIKNWQSVWGGGGRSIFMYVVGHCHEKNGESNFTQKHSLAAYNFSSANVTPQLLTTIFIALSLAYK